MARKSATTLLSELAIDFADNTNGDITPAIFRSFITDLINAASPGAAAITGVAPVSFTSNITPAKLLIFDTDAANEGGVATPEAASHQITIIEGGFYRVGARVSAEFASNRDLHVQVSTDGVPSGFTASGAGQGANKAVSISLAGGIISANAGQVITLEGYSDQNGVSVDNINCFLLIERITLS